MIYQAVQNRELRVPVVDSSATTGLTLASFTLTGISGGAYVADPATDFGLVLDEVDGVNAPGYYELLITPPDEGLLYLLLDGTEDHEVQLQVSHEGLDLVGACVAGKEGDVTVTVDNGTDPVEGATVRVFSGTTLVARALTDSDGEAEFGLPVGTYDIRISKSGISFDNPTVLTVVSNEEVVPILKNLVPGTASIGDFIAISGKFFDDTAEVSFGGTIETPVEVSSDGTLLIVEVPTGLTDTVIPVRVRKDDPGAGDYLTSSPLSMILS